MTMQAPTRITIEVHQPDPGASGREASAPTVRIVPEVAALTAAQPVTAAPLREDGPTPAAYEPGPCLCLDDEDCLADHAND